MIKDSEIVVKLTHPETGQELEEFKGKTSYEIKDQIENSTDLNTLITNLATVDTVVDAIKAKTDDITFTVANKVDSNVQNINDVELGGTGTSSDPMGRA